MLQRLRDWWHPDPQAVKDARWEKLSAQPRSMGGNALSGVTAVFNPQSEHVVAEAERQESDRVQSEAGQGDDDEEPQG